MVADARLRDGQAQAAIDILKPAYETAARQRRASSRRLAMAYMLVQNYADAIPDPRRHDGAPAHRPGGARSPAWSRTTSWCAAGQVLSTADEAKLRKYVVAYKGPDRRAAREVPPDDASAVTRRSYWHGCNYPWSFDGTTAFYGLDFGANVWGSHLGVSTRRDAVAARLRGDGAARLHRRALVPASATAAAASSTTIAGCPRGSTPTCSRDLDAALEIAVGTGVRVAFVMLDHRWMFEGLTGAVVRPGDGRQPPGHAAGWPRRACCCVPEGRDALFARVLEPDRRDATARPARARDLAAGVAAYELMNEPDFVVDEWEADLSRHVPRPLPFAIAGGAGRALQRRWCTRTALRDDHARWRPAAQPVGVGGSRALGLDLLQVHSYPDLRHPARDADIFGTPAASHAARRPLLLGEFPGNGPQRHPPRATPPPTTLDDYLEFAVAEGYAGAWPWSFSGTDDYGPLPLEPLARFARAHPELVNPRCAL